MWTESRRPLAAWIGDLVDACELDPLGGGERLRGVVSGWRAAITLDDETVVVSMVADRLRIEPADTAPVDGTGSATSDVVLALLDGRVELSDAVADGWIDALGHRSAVTRLLIAVEVLLDASARVPALRRLAAEFRDERGPGAPLPARDADAERRRELEVLAALGLADRPPGAGAR